MNNFASPVHLGVSLASYYGTYKISRMAYLRGTKKTPIRKAPSLANKVAALSAQVSKNKPEIQQFKFTAEPTTVVGSNDIDTDVSRVLVDNADFRDSVTGDKWYNKQLRVHVTGTSDIPRLRLIVYVPLRAGTLVMTGFANNPFDFIPDRTAWRVLYDRNYTSPNTAVGASGGVYLNLRSLMTIYNSDADVIDRNNIRVKLVYTSMALNKQTQTKSIYLCI
jgi:hypothetical protein